MMSVCTGRLWTDIPPHRLEVNDLRRFRWPNEGREPRDLYFSGGEFLPVFIIFALGKLHLLQDLAAYMSELLSPRDRFLAGLRCLLRRACGKDHDRTMIARNLRDYFDG